MVFLNFRNGKYPNINREFIVSVMRMHCPRVTYSLETSAMICSDNNMKRRSLFLVFNFDIFNWYYFHWYFNLHYNIALKDWGIHKSPYEYLNLLMLLKTSFPFFVRRDEISHKGNHLTWTIWRIVESRDFKFRFTYLNSNELQI